MVLLRSVPAGITIIAACATLVRSLSRTAPGRLLLYDFCVSINQMYYLSKSCIKQIWLVRMK